MSNQTFEQYESEHGSQINWAVEEITRSLATSKAGVTPALKARVRSALRDCISHTISEEVDGGWSYGVAENVVIGAMRDVSGEPGVFLNAALLQGTVVIPHPESWPRSEDNSPRVELDRDGEIQSIDLSLLIAPRAAGRKNKAQSPLRNGKKP